MEGVVLYVLLVKVFVEGCQRRYLVGFTVASYGNLSTTVDRENFAVIEFLPVTWVAKIKSKTQKYSSAKISRSTVDATIMLIL